MKKKVLYGVVMALFAGAAMAPLQSCKDELPDFVHQYKFDQAAVQSLIAQLRSDLNACKANCEAKIADLQAQITANDGDIAALQSAVQSLNAEIANRVTYDELNTRLSTLETTLKQYTDGKFTTLDGKISDLDAKLVREISAVNALISDLQGALTTLEGKHDQDILNLTNKINTDIASLDTKLTELIEGYVNELQEQLGTLSMQIWNNVMAIDELQVRADLHEKQLAAIENELTDLKATVGSNTEKIAELTQQVIDLRKKYDALNEKIDEEIVPMIEEYYNDLNTKIGQLGLVIQSLTDDLDALETQLTELTGRMNALITGILIQGTDNPIFGNFSLPLGVKSNILFDWFGQNLNPEFEFPSYRAENSFNSEEPLFTKADYDFLVKYMANADQKVTIPTGFMADEFNLGKLYLTVNPIGHKFENANFTLETSAGKALPYGLTITPSDDELYFGLSRGVANGFYEADVKVPANNEAIYATCIKIEDGLEDAAKDFVKNASKRTALDLLKTVYDQVNHSLPAYAVRYDWAEKQYSVLSQYDLAVATAQPLSYKFLEGVSTDKKIRTFGHVDNFLQELKEKIGDKLKAQLSQFSQNITVQGHTIGFVGTDNLAFANSGNGEVTVTVTGLQVDGQEVTVEPVKAEVDGILAAVNNAICDAIAEAIGGDNASDELKAEVKIKVDNVLLQLNQQVNDVLAKIQGKIDTGLDYAYDKAEPYFSRLNQIIDLYNKVANKINAVLANPNDYLQPALFYKASGKVGLLSCKKEDPTVFANGGGQAFNLFLTSYSGEIVAPAFKKFVACVNVYDADGKSVRDAQWKTLANINSYSSGLNRVLDGKTYKIAVPATDMKPGYTYEFVYQGVDYSGVTSTRKFYIKVK
ncbi:MAG: hypothetical protein K2K93_05535 [Muribaculaceae bacterium]|nr:hypothetical protein [Muribaculaceae bacterium]